MVSMLVFSVIPADYVMAGETGENGVAAMNIDCEEFDVDEPEIEIPVTEDEYLISDSCQGIKENEPILYAATQNVKFERAVERKAKFTVRVYGSGVTTKLTSKVYLEKKTGTKAYKYTGKKSVKSYEGKNMIHAGFFSVEKGSKYRIKIVIIEKRKDGKSYTKAPVYAIER